MKTRNEKNEEDEDDERMREQSCGEDSASNKKSRSNYTPETFPGRSPPFSYHGLLPSLCNLFPVSLG